MQRGFILKRWLNLNGWRAVRPPELHDMPTCPVDGTVMQVVAALVGDRTIRVGCCPRCSLVGYMDRPSAEHVSEYYRSTWMGETAGEATEKARRVKVALDSPAGVAMKAQERALLASLGLRPSDPVLEVGAGYGRTVHLLHSLGLRNLTALEACPARAMAVSNVYGVAAGNLPFETIEADGARYRLIIAHHVLEHTYNPFTFIQHCARLQQPGDYLCLSLPNFVGEPSMGVLFFWPHLWSFTFRALEMLLAQCGYQRHDTSMCSAQQSFIVAKRVENATHPHEGMLYSGSPDGIAMKLASGLGLSPSGSILTWQMSSDGATFTTDWHASVIAQAPHPRQVETAPIPFYYGAHQFRTKAPIEIQFPEEVTWCEK